MEAYRAAIFHCLDDPAKGEETFEYFDDGILLIDNGKIKQVGEANKILPSIPPHVKTKSYKNSLIIPGLIDLHTHCSQLNIMASPGEQLLSWLNRYTYPAEKAFADYDYAYSAAKFFLNELLRNGTTTACIFPTVHKASVEALFTAACELNMRIVSGKVLMDCQAPEYLLETAEQAYEDSVELIEKWQSKQRINYALLPRYALACSDELLKFTSRLYEDYPKVLLQTHLAENKEEVELVRQRFPNCLHYVDVYDHYNLLGKRSSFAHCIHLRESEFKRLAESQSSIAFCPSANLFLGSGLFNLKKAMQYQFSLGLGSDIGAGTSLNLFKVFSEAYKVQQLQSFYFYPFTGFYCLTLGAAKALNQDDSIGNFLPGKEADFIVLDLAATPLLEQRMQLSQTLADKIFTLMMLGDDRLVKETYLLGSHVTRD